MPGGTYESSVASTIGRALDFVYGAGRRAFGGGAVRLRNAQEARRAEVVVRPGEPLPQELRRDRQPSRLTNFQAVGSTPIARAALSASPRRKGVRPAAMAWVSVMSAANARYGTPIA